MSLINDLKKLLFGAKAVGKSAVEKANEKGKEALEEAKATTDESLEKVQQLAEDIGEKAIGTAEAVGKKILDVAGFDTSNDDVMDEILQETTSTKMPQEQSPFSPPPKTTPNEPPLESATNTSKATPTGQTPKSSRASSDEPRSTEELLEKLGEGVEQLGKQVQEKGGKAMEKAKELATNLGEKLLAARDELVRKAEEEAARSGEVPKDLADKLAEINKRIEDAISGNNQKFADKPLDLGGSELEKHEDFFEKARRFAEGEYSAGKPKVTGNSMESTKKPGKAKGFEDLDGDGDEIIDDAILDEEN